MGNQSKTWDNFWRVSYFSTDRDKRIISDEIHSLRWKKISRVVLDRFGAFKGLKTVEIGCGRAQNSLLMAKNGAEVTVIDSSDAALGQAQKLFSHFGYRAEFLEYDAFNLPTELMSKFDISMSFGLAEHFIYPERLDIFRVHLGLIKDNGIFFVGTPNAWCLPYRIFKVMAQVSGHWKVGQEIPFSPVELRRIARKLSLKDHRVFGSAFLSDIYYFYLVKLFERLTHHKLRLSTRFLELPTILDNYFGYSLVLHGRK